MLFRKFFFLFLALALSSSLRAQSIRFEEGTDYEVIATQSSVSKEVLEYFSYNCPHCYSFDPTVESYLSQKPEDVRFRRVPVGFGRQVWNMSARAYVLANALGKGDLLHSKLFDRVHTLNRPFKNEGDIKDFFLVNGVTEEEFNKSLKSFSATTLTNIHKSLVKKHAITSVPTVIVNAKYKVNISDRLDKKRFVQLVDYLTKLDM